MFVSGPRFIPHHVSEKNTRVQKCLYTTLHRVGIGSHRQSIVKARNDHSTKAPVNITFGHRHTEALRSGSKIEICEKHQTI